VGTKHTTIEKYLESILGKTRRVRAHLNSGLLVAIIAIVVSLLSSVFLLYQLKLTEDRIDGLQSEIITLETEIFRLQGLVGYWQFDESVGAAATDRSSYANTGILANEPSWLNSENCAFKPNGAGSSCLRFDGANDYMQVSSSSSLEPSEEITVSLWVNATIPRGTLVDKAFTVHSYPFYSYDLQLEPKTGMPTKAELIWSVTTDGVWTFMGEGSSEVLIDLKTWQFVTVVYDGSFMKEYVNGKLVASIPKTGMITYYGTPLQVAKYFNLDFYTSADIDDLRIYDRALPAYEVQNLYQSGKQGS
jgi:hypothetical protein